MGSRRLILFSALAMAAVVLAVVLPLTLINNEPSQNGEPVQYPMEVKQAVIDEAIGIIQSRGFWPEIVAGLGFGVDNIDLLFYGEAVPEVVEIVQSVIDDKAPGLPLKIVENVTIETQTSLSSLYVKIISIKPLSPIQLGHEVTLTAETKPGASCNIAVYYRSEPVSAAGLYTKQADNKGEVSWIWSANEKKTGIYDVTVTATLGDETARDTATAFTTIPGWTIPPKTIPDNYLSVESITTPVSPGDEVTLIVRTKIGASCSITVYYQSEPFTIPGLDTKIAEDVGINFFDMGEVTWTWQVDREANPGRYDLVITASFLEGKTAEANIWYTVR